MSSQSLSKNFPILASEFCQELNFELFLDHFSAGSNRKLWWRCSKKTTHVWKSSIKHRTNGSGCPYCSGRLASPDNNLADCHPTIASQLYLAKNIGVKADEITPSSGKKLWWQCPKIDSHVYQARVADRTGVNSGCPYCDGKKVDETNSLATQYPEIAATWHSQKNAPITPDDVTWGTNKKFYWQCEKEDSHVYQAPVVNKTSGQSGCTICQNRVLTPLNSLAAKYPDIADSWHPTKNAPLTPHDVISGGHKKYWWLCSFGHTWQTTAKSRIGGNGCPKCSNQTSRLEIRIYCELKALFTHVSWREKIDSMEADILLPTYKIVIEVDGQYWHKGKIDADNKKTLRFNSLGYEVIRLRESPLPPLTIHDICYNHSDHHMQTLLSLLGKVDDLSEDPKVRSEFYDYKQSSTFAADSEYRKILSALPAPPKGYSLLSDRPDVTKVWDYEANYPLVPEMFYPTSHKNILWHCNEGHTWKKSIAVWNKHSKCPTCEQHQNSLLTCYPEIAQSWHTSKNGDLLPTDVSKKSMKKVWWHCNEDHNYPMSVAKRTSGQGCPYCAGKRVGKDNNLAAKYPSIAALWHPTKNGDKNPEDFTYGSAKTFWWRCEQSPHHDHQMEIKKKTCAKMGCPYCAGKRVAPDNSLAVLRPDLAAQWHPSKNKDLTPTSVTKQSGKRVWWVCEHGHEFTQRIVERFQGISCPECRRN
jgi:hypothetical protein